VNEPLVFLDLVGLADPDRSLSESEDQWLSSIASELNPSSLTVHVRSSDAADEPGPMLERQLDGTWRAGRYVGELRRDGRVLEIRPRLGVTTIAAWMGAALNLRIVPKAAEHGGTAALIAELVAATWRSTLVEAARHGLPGFRSSEPYQGLNARGRLDVPGTLRLRSRSSPQLASVERRKLFDNPVTRSIVLADRVLDRRLGRRPGWRGSRVEEIIPRMVGAVGARPELPSRLQLDGVRYTPITRSYRRVAELSWQIARNRGLRASATDERAEGLLIDVAELWELFLVHCARCAWGSAQVAHGTRLGRGRALLESSVRDGAVLGRLYPDLVVGDSQQPWAIIDAKYKPLADPRGVDREDLYQLTSYLSSQPGPQQPQGMLAYPRFSEDWEPARAEKYGPWVSARGHSVRFERLPVDEAGCVAALAEIFRQAPSAELLVALSSGGS
jgi:5-methylcytosine-specific restriction enzyme subunit McrC